MNPATLGRVLLAAALALPSLAVSAVDDEIRDVFRRFVEVQNAHDTKALGPLLADSPKFLWITRGMVIWGKDAAMQRFAKLHEGTWQLEPEAAGLSVVPISESVAQLHVPVTFTTGAAGEPPQKTRMFLNQTLVKSEGAWRVMSIFPVAAPPR